MTEAALVEESRHAAAALLLDVPITAATVEPEPGANGKVTFGDAEGWSLETWRRCAIVAYAGSVNPNRHDRTLGEAIAKLQDGGVEWVRHEARALTNSEAFRTAVPVVAEYLAEHRTLGPTALEHVSEKVDAKLIELGDFGAIRRDARRSMMRLVA